jgi:hypothetical protein
MRRGFFSFLTGALERGDGSGKELAQHADTCLNHKRVICCVQVACSQSGATFVRGAAQQCGRGERGRFVIVFLAS